MKDLYEILGVKKTASEREIRKAFLKKSKQHHPDKGGDPEAFKELVAAHNILRDPEKRGKYDNGEDPDTIQSQYASEDQQILATVMTLFVQCVSLNDPEQVDVIEQIRLNLQNNMATLQNNIRQQQNEIKKFETVIKRLKCKDNRNIFAESAAAQIDNIKRTIAQLETQKKIGEGARKFLESYSYEIDPAVMDAIARGHRFRGVTPGMFGDIKFFFSGNEDTSP